MDLTTLKGTVQGYFDRAFQEIAERDFETPLANSEFGVKSKLDEKSGTFVQFRSFGDLPSRRRPTATRLCCTRKTKSLLTPWC